MLLCKVPRVVLAPRREVPGLDTFVTGGEPQPDRIAEAQIARQPFTAVYLSDQPLL